MTCAAPPSDNKFSMKKMDVAEFKLASSEVARAGDVVTKYFGGDVIAKDSAEAQAQVLVDKWLCWFKTESPEPPQVTRIDFLVAHPSHRETVVWTCEVGECGASLCSVEVHGRNIAALNNAVCREEGPRLRFPKPLPEKLPRNSGWKS